MSAKVIDLDSRRPHSDPARLAGVSAADDDAGEPVSAKVIDLVDRDAWLRVLPFVPARNYTIPTRARVPRLIVIHATADAEKPGSAAGVARYFGSADAHASAHFVVDPVEIVQCVRLEHVAWGAPGANLDGVHVELCGQAYQTRDEWDDADSRATLGNGARLVAALGRLLTIPILRLPIVDIRGGVLRGVCGHGDVSEAWPPPKNPHWDPGPGFPWDRFIAQAST